MPWQNLSPRVRAALLLAAVVALTFVVWDTIATYPVRLLVVFVHEGGHALATVLTGGAVQEMVVRPDLSGHVVPTGGWIIPVASSGYLAGALFGAGLVVASAYHRASQVALGTVGVALVLLALFFARPILGLAFPFGLAVGGLFVWAAVRAPASAVRGVLFYLALVSSLYALADIRSDLFGDAPVTDATILASHTGIPALVWAVLWATTALTFLAVAIRHALRNWS